MRHSRPELGSTRALALVMLAAATLLGSCASGPGASHEARWRAEWNARVDAAATRWENPCGDPEFDPWARDFLAACEPELRLAAEQCAERFRWVEARAVQCREWRAYLVRNHGRHWRIDNVSEPPTRVE